MDAVCGVDMKTVHMNLQDLLRLASLGGPRAPQNCSSDDSGLTLKYEWQRTITPLPDLEVCGAVAAAVAKCSFCVSVVDPRSPDLELIAVSDGFEVMTGYRRHEIIGKNCRFLNDSCDMNREQQNQLRIAAQTGDAFMARLTNKKKSGVPFINLLDMRGISVAEHVATGDDLWFLVGVQADITDLGSEDVPENHLPELQEVAARIRQQLRSNVHMGSQWRVHDRLYWHQESRKTSKDQSASAKIYEPDVGSPKRFAHTARVHTSLAPQCA